MDVMGVLISTYMYQTLGLQRSNGWSKSLSHREGSMEEADLEPGVGQ